MNPKEYEAKVARQALHLRDLHSQNAWQETYGLWLDQEIAACDPLIAEAFAQNNPLKAAVLQGSKVALMELRGKGLAIIAHADQLKEKQLKANTRKQTLEEQGYL